jgi:hypothetical protein
MKVTEAFLKKDSHFVNVAPAPSPAKETAEGVGSKFFCLIVTFWS